MKEMSEKIINIQDAFLNYMRKNKIPVTVFLLNGVKLTGIISCFDQSCIVMKREGYTQLIYKNAISTFSPHGPISVFDWNGQNSNDYKKKQEQNENYSEENDDNDDYEQEDFEEEYE